MKKLLVILVLLVYGSACLGMTVHFHFCCGQLKTVNMKPATDTDCSGNMQKSKTSKCCDDQKVEVKLKGEQHAEKFAYSFLYLTAIPACYGLYNNYVQSFQEKALVFQIFSPPPVVRNLRVLYCTYKI